MNDVTQVLARIEAGDPRATAELLPLVYDELRKLAAIRLAQEKPGQTLQATALVHEAYLRLVSGGLPSSDGTENSPSDTGWNSRGHFFAAAAEAMRRILVDRFRRQGAEKRGGKRQRVELAELQATDERSIVDLLALDEALTEFAAVDAQAAELVKLRYFGGLTNQEAAEVLGISPRTADRNWRYARTWLLHRLESP